MTGAARLRRARAALGASLAARALLGGILVAGIVIVAAVVADLVLDLPLRLRVWLTPLAVLTGMIHLLATLWRGRHVRSLTHVALWLEEQVPSLQYSLVTLLDAPRGSAIGALEARVAEARWGSVMQQAARRALAARLLAAALVITLLALLPRGAVARVGAPTPGDALRGANEPRMGGARRNPLRPLVAIVTPPAYSGEERRVLDEPTEIGALVGSVVTLRGRGAAPVVATVGERTIRAALAADGWSIALAMPERAVALRLAEGSYARLVALAPRVDAPPVVSLETPARDTVLRTAGGPIPLAAEAADDIGLLSAAFEYIVSSGSGETFHFRSGVLAPWRGTTRRTRLVGALSPSGLALQPGDVVHVRAVGSDGNIVSGPGKGVSETRTIRLARAGEYDSVAVEGAAPAGAERSALSQRMLIMLAEALERRRPRLAPTQLTTESRRIGADQTRLRKEVGEIIFARLGDEPDGEHAHDARTLDEKLSPEDLLRAADEATGAGAGEALAFAEGESPVVAINRPLLEAYNAMWDASRELDIGDPARALPHMRLALAAIQRARQADRIYLRGRPPTVVVDLTRVRLQGKETGAPAHRPPRTAVADPTQARAARFAAAVATVADQPAAAVDSLLLLRVDALTDAPSLAQALAEAIDALRAGRDATIPLARARRLLLGAPSIVDSLGGWMRRP